MAGVIRYIIGKISKTASTSEIQNALSPESIANTNPEEEGEANESEEHKRGQEPMNK